MTTAPDTTIAEALPDRPASKRVEHWRGLELELSYRALAGDGGATLRVSTPGPDGSREWLRFDCFDRDPHWHLDPDGRDLRRAFEGIDTERDAARATIDFLRNDLIALLDEAGLDPARLESVRSAAAPSEDLVALERGLRHRPPTLDELDLSMLRARRSEKWHTYPKDVLPVWVAEMDFPVAAPIEAELERFTRTSDFGYPIGLRETGLCEVFAERMNERFGWIPDPARVEILSEVVQGMYVALEAFSEKGEGIVVQTPIYPPFLGSVRETGRRLVENRMVQREPGGAIDFDLDALEALADGDLRILLFCNPHNPSGRVYTRVQLERIARFAIERDLVVVSDEIHGDLVFDDRAHVPLATIGPEIAHRTITLTSASKAFNIPGLRCAIAHFGDPSLQKRFNTVFPRHVRGGLGLIGLHATLAAWRWSQPWLDEVVPYLSRNRDVLEDALADRIPEIRVHRAEATYLAWLDVSGLDLEGSPARHFLREGRVALSDGRLFGAGWEHCLRFNFGTSRPILLEAVDRMAQALGR